MEISNLSDCICGLSPNITAENLNCMWKCLDLAEIQILRRHVIQTSCFLLDVMRHLFLLRLFYIHLKILLHLDQYQIHIKMFHFLFILIFLLITVRPPMQEYIEKHLV